MANLHMELEVAAMPYMYLTNIALSILSLGQLKVCGHVVVIANSICDHWSGSGIVSSG